MSVGWGVVENDAMELEIESANCGSWLVMAGRMEVPLHDVKTLVLWEFTKHLWRRRGGSVTAAAARRQRTAQRRQSVDRARARAIDGVTVTLRRRKT